MEANMAAITRLDELHRPKALVERYPDQFSMSTLRWWIYNSKENGLDEAGAILRIGRAIWIDVPRLQLWMAGHRTNGC